MYGIIVPRWSERKILWICYLYMKGYRTADKDGQYLFQKEEKLTSAINLE